MNIRVWFSFALLFIAACSAEQAPLTATSVRLTTPLPGMSMGAAYLQLHNHSSQDVRITRVASPQLDSVEMHESILENDISRMLKLPEVVVPAGQTVVFEPGAKHRLLRYRTDIAAPVTLQFFTGDALLLSVEAAFQD
jgi:copper(I)-binding protein